MSWSPWGAHVRPTADTINDDQLDELLERLEHAEDVIRILTRRAYPASTDEVDRMKEALFLAFRNVLHTQHTPSVHLRKVERCRTCIGRAHHLVYVWEAAQEWEPAATETRLKEIQDRIDGAPRTSWADPESAWRSREDVPWLLSQVRLAQRAVRRMRAEANRNDKYERRAEQRSTDLRTANHRLAEEIKQLKIFKSKEK